MRLGRLIRGFTILFSGAQGVAPASRFQSSPPNLLHLQAGLADAAGTPLQGPVTLENLAYDLPVGGAALRSKAQNTTALNGVVNLSIAIVPPTPVWTNRASTTVVS